MKLKKIFDFLTKNYNLVVKVDSSIFNVKNQKFMNKLVSKNPVLRFKLGKKILKGKDGLGENLYYYLGDNGIGIHDISLGINNDKRLTHRYIFKGKQYGSFDGGKLYYDLSSYKPLNFKSNQLLLNAIGKRNKPKVVDDTGGTGNKSRSTSSIGTSYQFGKMGGWNNSIGIGNITDPESVKMIKEMGLSGSAQDIQNKINEKFGSNAIKVDNKWGDQSIAGLKALYNDWKINKPETNSFLLKLISQLPNLDFKSVTPENIMRELIAMDGYKPSDVDLHLINISNTITNKTPTYVTANRSETRDWMRSNGINPYSVTGAMRAAARRLRAGQANDNDKLLVKGNEQLYNLLKSYFKKGGLISRNPIERFKSNFINKN